MSTPARPLLSVLLIAATAFVLWWTPAWAGPPLICYEIEIDDELSLPWGENAFEKASDFSPARLIDETLECLTDDAPVFVRMETLRRATFYLDRDERIADRLLGCLMARALDAEAADEPCAMAWFDAGYFAQCLDQMGCETSFGPEAGIARGAEAIKGYRWVKKALALAGSSPEMELAAALMTTRHSVAEHDEHLSRVLGSDLLDRSPAAAGILEWIATHDGTSVKELRARHDRKR